MPSPFPGMDPYLEAHWRDVHASLIIYASDALQGVLPGSLRARVEERVLLETPQGIGDHPLFPDVRVVEYHRKRGTQARPEAGVVVRSLGLSIPEATLSPKLFWKSSTAKVAIASSPSSNSSARATNPPARTASNTCASSAKSARSDANLVEIDLNRFGTHTLAFPLDHIKPQGRTAYMACVRRATRRGKAEVYPMPLWQRLPIMKIPLRPDDADVPLDFRRWSSSATATALTKAR